MSVKTEQFKDIMSKFATGVTVVTTAVDGQHHGLTVSAFCSVSLSPPLILVCIEKTAQAHERMLQAEKFVVNFLAADQKAISEVFADPRATSSQRFQQIEMETRESDIPVIAGSLGFIECRKQAAYNGGDHSIFTGEVIDLRLSGKRHPLLYYDRAYHHLAE